VQYHRYIQSNVGEYGAEVEAANAADGRKTECGGVSLLSGWEIRTPDGHELYCEPAIIT
jgi:hypothetical protein